MGEFDILPEQVKCEEVVSTTPLRPWSSAGRFFNILQENMAEEAIFFGREISEQLHFKTSQRNIAQRC